MMKSLSRQSVPTRCRSALADGYLQTNPGVVLGADSYLSDYREALIPGVHPDAFVADLMAGAGNELEGKFRAPHSSSALAVNAFGWFAGKAGLASLAGHEGLELVGFEKKFSTGLTRAQPPNLDVVLQGPSGLVAVESKCIEYLSPKEAKFSPRYRDEIVDERRNSPWFAEMIRLMEEERSSYRHLDVAQLIKHALGLSYRQERDVTLVYVWWEPANADEFPVFAAHREEVRQFAARISGGALAFAAVSYPELWAQWAMSSDETLQKHSANLQRRYARPI
ncbi:hypothetical protein WJS89_06465 [Sphingomicrobium sp. XHP0235]|uniref:PGN_0703 family putative restriction endonuclease n=1 Tax=Sphingomicrobium aquimarinum TaxID=3133971 RepID=UPI0031FE9F41